MRPAGPSELEAGWVEFFQHPGRRSEIQTLMALLKCEPWQAILVHQAIVGQTAHIEVHTDGELEEGDDWGPGAKPKGDHD